MGHNPLRLPSALRPSEPDRRSSEKSGEAQATALTQITERSATALREGADALHTYAVALEQAQRTHATASVAQADAEAEANVAKQELRAIPPGQPLPAATVSQLDAVDAQLAQATRAVEGALADARRAAQQAAVVFRTVAAQADSAAGGQGPATVRVGQLPAESAEANAGGGLVGWIGDAAEDVGEQVVGFGRGFIEGVDGLREGAVTVAKLTPFYRAIDPEGYVEHLAQVGLGARYAVENPGEFAKAVVNWEDLAEGRYGEWLGNLAPDAMITVLTYGAGAAVSGSGRGLRVVDEVGEAATAARRVPAPPVQALVAPGKYDYLFGNVASNAHNAARSAQNAAQLARIGVHDNAAGRALLQQHFDEILRSDANIVRSFDTPHGSFQVRDSLFAGPGGFLHFESTWQVTDDGLRLTTVIPRGGPR